MIPPRLVAHVHPDLLSIAPAFITRARAHVIEMHTALGAGDFVTVSRLAHQIAGSGTTFGMPLVTESCRELERIAHLRDVEATRALLASIGDYLSRVEVV